MICFAFLRQCSFFLLFFLFFYTANCVFYEVDFGVPEPFISCRYTHFVEQNICCIYVMDTFQMEYSEPWFFGDSCAMLKYFSMFTSISGRQWTIHIQWLKIVWKHYHGLPVLVCLCSCALLSDVKPVRCWPMLRTFEWKSSLLIYMACFFAEITVCKFLRGWHS